MDIKKEIQKRGLKQKWVAEKVGITETYLWYIIVGQRKPSDETLKKIINTIKGVAK